jgi:hypothetical protein
MATILAPDAYLPLLRCPCSSRGLLSRDGEAVRCGACNAAYEIKGGTVLDLVDPSSLDPETAREWRGNLRPATPAQIAAAVSAERRTLWRSFYSLSRRRSIKRLAVFLDRIGCDRIFSLGSGTGREIEYLLHFRPLAEIYCSDLSLTSLQFIPAKLAPYDLRLGLFTSDLNHCPVENSDVPIVIVNALHHTGDMHAALEGILARGPSHVFFVEPTDNALIRFLARKGVARRVEYSGVNPGRLHLRKLRTISRRCGFRIRLATMWIFPEDYYRRIFGKSRLIQKAFIAFLDVFSAATNLIKFGNASVVHLERIHG